jgi:deazaflavin-dependent oxidoreductase (nitroreductase family)
VDLAALADSEYCYLTTTGRRTGEPHEIEIWFATAHGVVYMLSGRGDRADWVRNLRADNRVLLRIGDHTWRTAARTVVDPQEEATARRLLAAKYQGWTPGAALSEWATTALPVAVDVPGRDQRPPAGGV